MTDRNNQELENCIVRAKTKVNKSKLNDLCRYIPDPDDLKKGVKRYIHHFTMKKLKQKDPKTLVDLITTYILNETNPVELPPKTRAPRGSKSRNNQPQFSKEDLSLMRQLALRANEAGLAKKLAPKESYEEIKRRLVQSIKADKLDQYFWDCFVDAFNQKFQTVSA